MASSQIQTRQNTNTNSNSTSPPSFNALWKAYPKDGKPIIVTDNSEFYMEKWLKEDYREADVVAYIDSKEVLSVGRSDEYTDCVDFTRNTGPGYCSFTMRAEIKELYKGRLRLRTIEYSEYGEAQNITKREHFLGKKVVFLEKHNGDDGKNYYQVIENSTRDIENEVLSKMRKISKYKGPKEN